MPKTKFEKLINKGKDSWNTWMKDNPMESVEFGGLDLSGKDLSGYDFSVVVASYTNFSGCNLRKADFSHADLTFANFEGADISKANFEGANLAEALLIKVKARKTDFYQATLEGAKLMKGQFQHATFAMARLLNADLSDANITSAILWDTQRTLWTIRGIKCKHCFWGGKRYMPPSEYNQGEFEKLHSYKPTVVVHFPDGVNPIEIYSLSHLSHLVEKEIKGSRLRISSFVESGKGADVHFIVEDCEEGTLHKIDETLNRIPSIIREESTHKHLQGINEGLELAMNKLIKELANSSSVHIGRLDGAYNIVSTGLKNTIDWNQTTELTEALISELRRFLIEESRTKSLGEQTTEAQDEATRLLRSMQTGKKANPKMKTAANNLMEIIKGAAGSATWKGLSALLQQLF